MKAPLAVVAALGIGAHAMVMSCSGKAPLPPEDVAACLAQFNGELGGATTCDAIVRSIAAVISRDSKCSELLMHGLRCEAPKKDGG